MNSLKFLYAAYIVTWIIHVTYIATLISRHSRLRREAKEAASGIRSPVPKS
jgi:CcmD family protein